jgi:mRNA-degrading endonuclease RelE of RelBE toxin-antitoxin system
VRLSAFAKPKLISAKDESIGVQLKIWQKSYRSMEVLYTARFIRSYKKLPVAVQHDVESALLDYKDTKNHERLKLHKLHGNMKQYHAFSANFSYRIVVKIEKNTTYCMDVGDHTVYE